MRFGWVGRWRWEGRLDPWGKKCEIARGRKTPFISALLCEMALFLLLRGVVGEREPNAST